MSSQPGPLDGARLVTVIALQVLLDGMLALNDGPRPSFQAEPFPTRVRYSGFAVGFPLASALLRPRANHGATN